MYYMRCMDGRRSALAENPANLFPHFGGKRACTGVAEGIARSGTPGHRQGSVAGAMAVAGRDAPVPAVGQRAVGSPDGLADQADGARAGLGLLRTPRGAAWVHQENAHDAG